MTEENKNSALSGYRIDIDGLRGLAILAVVAFHAFPKLVRGGFAGVDVFFVISGYLISRIIIEKLNDGSFSFSDFYARRIKRIFPALILVLASCLVLGWFALLSDEYRLLGRHISAGAGFVSNLVYWSEAGYFDKSADTKPLLHLWSLSIEEQFYMLWPLLVWLAWKCRFNIFMVAAAVIFASFLFNIHGVKVDTNAAFYSPQTRFWELLIGSLIATFFIYRKKTEKEFKTLCDGLSMVGLLLLVLGFVLMHKGLAFPGFWALVPVLGSALIISAGSNAWVNRKILSNKVVVWFGSISYPLYLWHWPLLSFAMICESEVPSSQIRFMILVLSTALAWLTCKFVEMPIRFGRPTKLKIIALVVSMSAVGCMGYDASTRDAVKFRQAEEVAKVNRFDFPYRGSCKALTGELDDNDWCNSGTSPARQESAMVIGDSFANSFAITLNAYARGGDEFSFRQIGRGECPSLLDYGPGSCREISRKAFDYIKNSTEIKTVVLAANWSAYYRGKRFSGIDQVVGQEVFKEAFERTVQAYREAGKNIVVFLAVPSGSNPKSCIARPVRLTDRNNCALTIESAHQTDGNYRQYLIPFLQGLQIPYFDPFKYLCNDAGCTIEKGGRIFYADGRHLSIFGGEFLAEKGANDLRAIFAR